MKETLVKIKVDKQGTVDFNVSEIIQEFTYEQMCLLREAFCLAIGESEELFKEGQQ